MSSASETTTKRISDEVFAEVERELAASAVPATAAVAEALPQQPAVLPSDRFNELSKLLLPYVWTTAVGVWAAGLTIMNSTIPLSQCIGAGIVVAGVLSALVFAWRSRPA